MNRSHGICFSWHSAGLANFAYDLQHSSKAKVPEITLFSQEYRTGTVELVDFVLKVSK